MKEKWKEIKGYRETYEVSNLGNVRRKTRPGSRGSIVNGKTLKQRDNSNGYLRVGLRLPDDKRTRDYLVHRLVADAFVPETENKPYINHIDGDKHNNTVDNLERCTRSENEKHAWNIGLKNDTATKGELHGMHKLHNEDVLYIREHHKRNGGDLTTGELAEMFRVNPQTITEIVSRRIWKHI